MKWLLPTALLILTPALGPAADPDIKDQLPNAGVKRGPLAGGPVSPGLGYEAALA